MTPYQFNHHRIMVFKKNLDRLKNPNLLKFTFNEIRKFFSVAKKRTGIIIVRLSNIIKWNCDEKRENLKNFNEVEKNRSDILKCE